MCVFFRGIFPGGLCSIWTAIFSPNDCWWPWPAKAWQGSPQVIWSLLRLVVLGCRIWPGFLLLWSWNFLFLLPVLFLCFSSVSWFSNPFWRCAHQLWGVVQTLFGTQGIGDVGWRPRWSWKSTDRMLDDDGLFWLILQRNSWRPTKHKLVWVYPRWNILNMFLVPGIWGGPRCCQFLTLHKNNMIEGGVGWGGGGWGVGWGGVGWDDSVICCTFSCTCTHTSCYAAVRSHALAHIRHATLLYVLMHLHTYVMPRCCTFSCTCTHTSCYAAVRSHAFAHIRHATLL